MKTIAENIALLLRSEQALTIQKTDEGFIIAFSELEEDEDESPIFVPLQMFATKQGLEEALDTFYVHHQMATVQRYSA